MREFHQDNSFDIGNGTIPVALDPNERYVCYRCRLNRHTDEIRISREA